MVLVDRTTEAAVTLRGKTTVFTCFSCGQLGHKSDQCTNAKVDKGGGKGGGKGSGKGGKGGKGGGGRGGKGGGAHQRELNSQLARAADRAEINQLVLQHSAAFNSVNCSTALHRLAKCAPASSSSLAATDAHWKKSWSAAAKATSAEATSSSDDAKVEALLCRRCVEVLEDGSEVTARSLTSIAWATGKLKLAHIPLRAAFSSQATAQLSRGGLDAFGIANVAWALATLHTAEKRNGGSSNADFSERASPEESLLDALADAACANSTIDDFKPQELCNLLWAFATLRRPHAALFETASHSASKRITMFSAQGLSQTLWSFAKLGLATHSLFQAAASAAVSRLGMYDAQSVATLAWSFGSAELQHPVLMAALSKEFLSRPTAFDLGSCAQLLWALSHLNEGVDPHALAALSHRLTLVADEDMQSKQLLFALGALAKLKSGGEGGGYGGSGGVGSGAALATLLCEAASKAAPTLTGSKLGITAWALSRPAVQSQLPLKTRVVWKQALRDATIRVASELSWRCVSHIEIALRVLQTEAEGERGGCGGSSSCGTCLAETIDGKCDPVVSALDKAARRSIDLANEKSIARNSASVSLLLATLDSLLQSENICAKGGAGGSVGDDAAARQVLLAGFDACDATSRLDEVLKAAGLTAVHWRRFASSRHDSCASVWPAKASAGSYVACIVRWSWYAAGEAASMMIHACASVTSPGTPLWLCGNAAEGVDAAGSLLESAYGESNRLVGEDGCALFASARGSAGAAAASSARGSLSGWLAHSTLSLPPLSSLLQAITSGSGGGKKRRREGSPAKGNPAPAKTTIEVPWQTYPGG